MNDTDLDVEFQQRMAWYVYSETHVRQSWKQRLDAWLSDPWKHVGIALLFLGVVFSATAR